MQAGAASVAFALPGRTGTVQSAEPQPLTLVTNRAPSDVDPHSAYDVGSGLALRGPFEGLICLKPGFADEYLPVLAESWTVNADKSVWEFRIRPGVTFHNGTPLDAEAARASFERLLSLGLAPSTVLGRFIDDPSRVVVVDPMTLRFDLGRPQPLFIAALASAFGTAIVNVKAARQHEVDGDWGTGWAQGTTDGLGTGPFRITRIDLESGVEMERFQEYWQGWEGPHVDSVRIRIVVESETRRLLLERGETDIATTLPLATVRDLEQNPSLRVDHRLDLNVRYLAMTVAGPLQTVEARRALCWAFPYNEVIDGVLEGFAKRAVGPVAELCRGFAPDTFVYETDLQQARALLTQAGIGEGTELTIAFPEGNLESIALAELFQANLAEIGIGLTVQTIDFATYIALFSGEMPAEERPNLLGAFWSPDYNDAWNHLWPQVSCDAWQSGNGGQYCNNRVEELLTMARDAADDETYMAALSEIQQIVTWDDPAAIYFAQPETLTVLLRDIQGFEPDLVNAGIFDYYRMYRGDSQPSA
jgi:peptide/nickel transport system substrate-binding protein